MDLNAPPSAAGFDGERFARTFAPCGAGFVLAGLALGGPSGFASAVLGLLLLALATHSRTDGLILLGPAARWELTRSARRSRMFRTRIIVVLTALLLTGYQFYTLTHQSVGDMLDLRPSTVTPATAAVATGRLFWTMYLFVGFTAGLSAIATLSAVVAEERESGRLDHALTTDLRSREIVVGKLVGRFGLVAAGLAALAPLPALFPLVGGVDGRILMAAGITLGFGVIGVAGVGLWNSAHARRSWDAIRRTAAMVGGYLFFGLLIAAATLDRRPPIVAGVAGGKTEGIPTVAKVIGVGNPLVIAAELYWVVSSRQIDNIVNWVVFGYVPFHTVVFGLGLARAVRTLRAESPERDRQQVKRDRRLASVASRRPAVSDRPILWYELHGRSDDHGGAFGFFRRWWPPLLAILLLACSAVAEYGSHRNGWSPYSSTYRSIWDPFPYSYSMQTRVAWWVRLSESLFGQVFRYAGLWAMFAVTLPATFAAARSVTREKELDTFEALILSGVRPDVMIRHKWLGAISRQRGKLLALGLVAFVGSTLGVIPFSGCVALFTTTAVYTVLGAAAGVVIGAYSRTMWQASVRLGMVAVAWGVATAASVWFLESLGLNRIERAVAIGAIPPMPQILSASWGGVDRDDSTVSTAFAVIAGSVTLLMAIALWPVWERARKKYARDLDPVAEHVRRAKP